MNLVNSLSFLIFGLIMRFLPVFAPMLVAHSSDPAVAEANTRALWLIAMGYVTGVIGIYYTAKNLGGITARAIAFMQQRAHAIREARELAHAREARQFAREQASSTKIIVRAHY